MAVHAESSIQLNTIPAYTSLLGGHFYYKSTGTTQDTTPPSANVIQIATTPSNPSTWGYNTHIGANGIKLRYNEVTLSEWINNCLTFYKPGTTNPSLQVIGGNNAALNIYNPESNVKTLGLDANGLSFYGTSVSAPDVTLNANGLTLINGSIRGGVVGQDEFLYLSPQVFSDEYEEYVLSADITVNETKTYYTRSDEEGEYVYTEVSEPTGSPQENEYYEIAHAPGTIPIDNYVKTNWREIIGIKFAVDTEGNLYANNANISGKIIAIEGQIGGWNIGTDTNKSLFYGNQVPGAATNNLVISSSSVENTVSIAGSGINKHWFLSAGTKFGVDTEGNLYANNANLSNATVEGAITATSLIIGNNGSSYNAWDAINITGYSLDIEVDATGVSDIYNTTYLYPHLYHNGTEITLPSSATTAQKQEFYNKFLWYEGDSSTAVQGDYLNKGRILASYGDYWRVTYTFDDGATEGATPTQQVIVDPSTYITRINDDIIKVHSKNWNENTGYVQINNQGNIIATGQIYQETSIPLTSVQLIKW